MNIINRFMTKNKFFTTALILVLPLFLVACSLGDLPVIGRFFGGPGGGSVPSGPVTLNMWGLWEDPDVMDALIKKYQESNPNVTINYDDRSVLDPNEYKGNVYDRAGQEGSPDIMIVHNSWVPGLKDSLAPAPQNLLNESSFSERFYSVASKSAVFEGDIFAIPLYYDGLALVYNKDHFDEVDQQEPPNSWEVFRKLALKLKVFGPNNELVRGGAALGTENNVDFATDILGLLFSQANVTVPGEVDKKAAQDALAFYVNFAIVDKVWNESFPEATTAFASEKVSMVFIPSWNLLDVLRARPDLNVGVAPVPQAIPEEPASWATFWMGGVSKSSSNKAAAWDFLNFLAQDEQQLMMFDLASKAREFGAPYSPKSLQTEISSNEFLSPYVNTAPFARSGIIAARAGNKTAEDAVRKAIETARVSQDYEEALKTAKEALLRTK